jgi:nucleotide-binding universal stress UspA family protein
MNRTIVVGYDGSEIARAAVACAARRAGEDGKVIVAHVTAVPTEFIGTPYHEYALKHARERAETLTGDVEEVLPGDVQVERETVEGPTAPALVKLAQERDADEIAVGSRGFGAFRTATLGSTSHALLHEADGPLLVVPRRAVERARRTAAGGRDGRPRAVVVGYDGSDFARGALDYARERAGETGSSLIAVHAYDAPPDWLGRPYYQRALDDRQARGRELLAELEEQLGSGARVETDLIEGPPAEALTRAAQARDAEEIVVGSRGLGGVRAAVGSVSYALLHEADCPVVVVPRPNGEQ